MSADRGAIGALEGLRHPPIRRGDPGYEAARRVWNGYHDRSPEWLLRCVSATEVSTALRFAREIGLPLAVRGGGHSFPGHGTCDGGVVIDLGPLRGIDVDSARGSVSVGGGATWGGVDAATAPLALAVPGGLVSTTGVGGLTLGGGIGWLSRAYGLSCDQMIGAEVVLADGTCVHASECDEPELFWALRGGGGNFGVVTRFDFRLRPLPPGGEVLGGTVFYPAEAAGRVLRGLAELGSAFPDTTSVLAAFVSVPPLPLLPASLHFAPALALALCDLGDAAEAEDRARLLRTLATPLADLVRRQPWVEQQRMFDEGAPPGLRQYGLGVNLATLSEATIERLAERAAQRPTPLCQIHIHQMGGAVARVDEAATAYAGRDAGWVVHVIATWTDPADDERAREWARGTRARLAALAAERTYLNFLGESGADDVRRAFGAAKHERLRAAKRRYDPDNLFRLNANIPPAG